MQFAVAIHYFFIRLKEAKETKKNGNCEKIIANVY